MKAKKGIIMIGNCILQNIKKNEAHHGNISELKLVAREDL